MGRNEVPELVISECKQYYGRGRVFPRTDGLAFEGRRAEKREKYLREHPETKPEYRALIEQAAVTPGMLRDEVIAAWGLIEEDPKNLIGRKTADEHDYYARWRGFNVGRPYELFLIHNTVVGVREDPQGPFRKQAPPPPPPPPPVRRPEAEPPRALREVDAELARAYFGYCYSSFGDDGRLFGTPHDYDTFHLHVGMDTSHLFYEIEYFTSLPEEFAVVERRIEEWGGAGRYRAALRAAGLDPETAALEERARVALAIADELRPQDGSR